MAKGKANAGQRRKPRGPVIDQKTLKEIKDNIIDREVLRLAFRLEMFEELRRSGELNTPFIALEALSAIAGGKVAGRTEKALQSCWPKDWGGETVTVPLSLLLALRDSWHDYKTAPCGKSLGEALKIEGGGQGNKPMKSRLKTIDRARALAREVECRYLQIEDKSDSLTQDEVLDEVANKQGASFQSVKDAHKAHVSAIRRELEALGIIKGVKTSRS